MSKKIIAKIEKKTGKLTITTEGYSGPDCLEATKALEEGLGMDQACSVPTEEMYKVKEGEQQQIGGA